MTPKNNTRIDPRNTIQLSWEHSKNQIAFEVQYKQDGGEWIETGKTYSSNKYYNISENVLETGRQYAWQVRVWYGTSKDSEQMDEWSQKSEFLVEIPSIGKIKKQDVEIRVVPLNNSKEKSNVRVKLPNNIGEFDLVDPSDEIASNTKIQTSSTITKSTADDVEEWYADYANHSNSGYSKYDNHNNNGEYQAYNNHTNSGYNNHSEYYNHDHSNSNWGSHDDYSNHSHYSCNNHTNSGYARYDNHTNSGYNAYINHSDTN
jgi:hypothetical protein